MAINREINTRITLTLPIEIKEQLDKLAKNDHRTTSNYIQNIIIKHLESLEDSN